MWDWETSPFYKTGAWDSDPVAYRKLTRDILLEPEYLKIYVLSCIYNTLSQLGSFGTPYAGAVNTYTEEAVRDCLHEWKQYNYSAQFQNQLDFNPLRERQNKLVFASLALLVLAFFHPRLSRRLTRNQRWVTALLLLGILLNAAVCTSLSTIDLRYGSRVVWLLPLLIVVLYANDIQRLAGRIEQAVFTTNPTDESSNL